ncbi:MAG: hypothetical protein ABC596_05885 [Candidatus Methanosuratincola petrocarbonis]
MKVMIEDIHGPISDDFPVQMWLMPSAWEVKVTGRYVHDLRKDLEKEGFRKDGLDWVRAFKFTNTEEAMEQAFRQAIACATRIEDIRRSLLNKRGEKEDGKEKRPREAEESD